MNNTFVAIGNDRIFQKKLSRRYFIMSENTNTKTLERMKQSHELTLERMKLKNALDIEKKELNTKLKLTKLESEKSQIGAKREIFNLSNLVRKDKLTRRAGNILKFWAIVVTLISTLITIAGGYKDYSNTIYSIIGFVGAVIILQFTVFIIASQETRIKQEFFSHAWKCTILKYSLLAVSIYNNYRFFNSDKTNSLITLILCIALDLICVFLVGLAYDQITLNIFTKDENRNKNIVGKIWYNLTSKFVNKIDSKYHENFNLLEVDNFKNNKITIMPIEKNKLTSSLSPKAQASNNDSKDINTENTNISVDDGKTIKPIGFTNNNNAQKPDILIDRQENKENEIINLKDDILKYLEYMYSNIKNKMYSPGKREIKTAIDLKYRTIDLIWEQLEKLKIIEVVKVGNVNKSKILKQKDEAKKLIHKHF